jgi:hypothetical protein
MIHSTKTMILLEKFPHIKRKKLQINFHVKYSHKKLTSLNSKNKIISTHNECKF